jgi:hypothetical protein
MQYLKVLAIVIATVLVAAMFTVLATDKIPVAEKQIAAMSPPDQEKLWRAYLAEKAKEPGSTCKLSDDLFDSERKELLLICDEKGMLAYVRAKTYPQHFNVFVTYFNEPLFWEVVRTSEDAVPIIAYLIQRESRIDTMKNNLRVAVQSVREKRGIPATFDEITPEQYGLMGIVELSERGHEMMAEFEIVSGEARRKQFTRALNMVVNFFTGNTKDFERIYVRAERMPTWRDYGKVAIDAAVVFGAVGIVAKGLKPVAAATRIGTATKVGTQSLGVMGMVGRSLKLGTVLKVGAVATIGATIYNPRFTIGVLKSIAEKSGVNPQLFLFGFYAFLISLIPGAPLVLWLIGIISIKLAFGARRLGNAIARRI